jgi:hypothetical protein
MLATELRAYYGSWAKMSRELDMSSSTYQNWLRNGYIPFTTQCLIEKKTNRRFKADMNDAK